MRRIRNWETNRLAREYAYTRDPRVKERLVRSSEALVRYLTRRYTPTVMIDSDDLFQVGTIGLTMAAERFDPSKGVMFTTFAVPTILGEIKRCFRDQTWSMKVPRKFQELIGRLPLLQEELHAALDREPTTEELARAAGMSEEVLGEVLFLANVSRPASLDQENVRHDGEEGGADGYGFVGEADPGLQAIEEREALRPALRWLGKLDPRLALIIERCYFEDRSQTEIARELGISQMHVSRLHQQALRQLRAYLS